jgi:uncharacterized cupin superfamily protein
MSAAVQDNGVVIDWPDLRRLDTREMRWEEFPGLAGTKVKVLSRDEHGNPMVFLQWLPPGGLESVELPHRHFHRSVREFAYVLSGELPHWEYASADAPGELVRFKEGFFMDRRPGSIHGLEPGPQSSIGCTLLMWRDGVGTMVDEPQFAAETVEVPYPGGAALPSTAVAPRPGADGVVLERPDVTLLDTRAMPWEDFAGLHGARVKMLSRDAAGNGVVWLVWLPGDIPSVNRPHRHYHRTIREFSYLVAGELPHWEYRDAAQQHGDLVVVREGFFMERAPGSIHGLEEGPSSPIGCVLLQWRDGVGNYLNEPEAVHETVDVPYAG